MKYVVLREITGSRFMTFVACVAPITHKELADKFAKTHTPVSAGFFEFLPDGRVSVFGESTSLNLKPAAGDGPLIEAMAKATRGIGRQTPRVA